MTTLYKDEVQFAQCGKSSEQVIVGSTSSWGSPDLDNRPAEVMRSTLLRQVQACPHCGYCMPCLSEPVPDISALLGTNSYREQLESKDYPELANRFLCSALVFESLGRPNEAGWACIHAAWACDDARNNDAAKKCRLRAEQTLSRAIAQGQGTAERPGFDFVILADLLRRAGEFNRADQRTQEGWSPKCDKEILLLLVYERWLCRRRDAACHTVEEGISTTTKMLLETPDEN